MNERSSFEKNSDSGLSPEHFFQPRNSTCCSLAAASTLVQQVVDRLVASRGHPDAPALRDQMDDELRAGPTSCPIPADPE